MNKLIYSTVLVASLTACGGGKVVLHAQPPQSADIQVTPLEVYIGGKKLWVRLQVTNTSPTMLVIQRDLMTAHLPSGQTVGRAMGTYGLHDPYVLPPGSAHLVYVEFAEEGFHWKDMPSAQIDFAGAVTRNGQPVAVPPFLVTR